MTRWLPWVVVAALSSCAHPAAQVAGPAAPEKKVPVAIEIPRREGPPVVVLPLRLVRAPLLGSERARLERWLGRHLATQTDLVLDVIPLEEVARAPALVCAAKPSFEDVLTRTWPEALRAQPVADCSSDPCRLTLTVGKAGEAPLATWAGEVPRPGGFEQWEQAAQRLSKAVLEGVPSADVSSPADDEPIQLTAVTMWGGWNDRPSLDSLQNWRRAFAKCHARGVVPGGPDLLVLEVGADGRVARCEAQSWRDPAEHDPLRCQCEAAQQMTFAPGRPDRRLALELRDTPDLDARTPDGGRVIARIDDYRSTDPGLESTALDAARPWLALCYANTRLRAPIRFPVAFEIAPTGEITAARMAGDAGDGVLGRCLEGYLRYLPLPCTRSGQPATLEFVLHLQREQDDDAQLSPVSSARR